jgi:hypothetical protein
MQLALTTEHRATVAETVGGLVEQGEQVHLSTHSEFSAKSDRYLVDVHPPSTTIS